MLLYKQHGIIFVVFSNKKTNSKKVNNEKSIKRWSKWTVKINIIREAKFLNVKKYWNNAILNSQIYT